MTITPKTLAVAVILLCVGLASADTVSITFLRQDYTGSWLDSILHMQENVSGGWYDHFNSTWMVGGTAGPATATVNYDYQIILTKDGSSFNKGIVRFYVNGTLPIQITAPIIGYGSSPAVNLTLSTWQNRTLGKVYCFYNYTGNTSLPFQSAVFNVYNASVFPPSLLYSASDTTDLSATFSYTIPYANGSYRTDCTITINNLTYSRVDTYGFGNFTARFMGPSREYDFLGYTNDDVFKGLSLFMVVFVMGIGSMATSSIMALAAVGLMWLFYYWGWLSINPIILGFLLVFAVVYRFRQGKEGKG